MSARRGALTPGIAALRVFRKILRVMRKASPIDALLTKSVQGVLAATLMQPERWWYLSDLARFLHRTPSSLQGALAALVKAGVLHRKEEGNRVYYQADRRCPFHSDLRGMIAKTVGLVDVLREALRPQASRIDAAFVFGSVARATERSASDIDLGIIGTLGRFDLAIELAWAEERLGRPINTKLWQPSEFKKRRTSGDHFVTTLIRGEKLMVMGSGEWLEKTRGRRSSRASQNEPKRTRGDS
jgi:predicted nucleotidyltransferase